MKVNKWNEIKQGHTSLEGQQMGTEMEVIFFPCVSTKMGKKKAVSFGQKASCHFAQSAATRINKNIGLRGTLCDRGGSLILMEKDSSFVKKSAERSKNPGEVKAVWITWIYFYLISVLSHSDRGVSGLREPGISPTDLLPMGEHSLKCLHIWYLNPLLEITTIPLNWMV